MPTTPPNIDDLPTPPDPSDRGTFNLRAYPWTLALDTLVTQIRAAITNVFNNATEAVNAASDAQDSAVSAGNSAATAVTKANEAAASRDLAVSAASSITAQVAVATHAAAQKTRLSRSDELPISDAEGSYGLKKTSVGNLMDTFAVAHFFPHQAAVPNMTVVLDAGVLMANGAPVSQSQQGTSTIVAPGTNSRIDRVVIDAATGAVSVVTGAASASPVPPSIPAGKLPVCQVGPLLPSTTAITNDLIHDERTSWGGVQPSDLQSQKATTFTTEGTAPAFTLTTTPLAPWIGVKTRLNVTFHADGTTGSNTINPDGRGNINLKQYDSSGAKVPAVIKAGMNTDLLNDGTDVVVLSPLPSLGVIPKAHITGLLPTAISGTNTTAAVTISSGQAADSTGAKLLVGPGHSWAVSNGNAANGYQGGTTLPNSSTIHFFECFGSSGYCSFASTSLTPTLPTGYNSNYRRIFSIQTNGSGALIPINAVEGAGGSMIAWLVTQVADVNGATPTTANRTLYALSVPSGIKVQPFIRASGAALNNGTSGIFTSPDETDVAPAAFNVYTAPAHDMASNSASTTLMDGSYNAKPLTTNTSGQIGYRGSSTSATLSLVTSGYMDFRRV